MGRLSLARICFRFFRRMHPLTRRPAKHQARRDQNKLCPRATARRGENDSQAISGAQEKRPALVDVIAIILTVTWYIPVYSSLHSIISSMASKRKRRKYGVIVGSWTR